MDIHIKNVGVNLMEKAQKEAVIGAYFNMWIKRDFSAVSSIFAADIYYSECYGPEYNGLQEMNQWIHTMLQKQKVLEWRIKRFLHENDTVVVEWFFKEQQDGTIHEFDGVSIIEFQTVGKIVSVKEFQSKSEQITPYGKRKTNLSWE